VDFVGRCTRVRDQELSSLRASFAVISLDGLLDFMGLERWPSWGCFQGFGEVVGDLLGDSLETMRLRLQKY
jgi:hypothetical protein